MSIKGPEEKDVEGFQKVLHFGSVAVGCTAERQIKLYNPSVVYILCRGVGIGAGLRTTGLGAPDTHPYTESPPFHTFGSKPHVTHVY